MTNTMQMHNNRLHIFISGNQGTKESFVIWNVFPVITIPHQKYGDAEYVIGYDMNNQKVPIDDYRKPTLGDSAMLKEYEEFCRNKMDYYTMEEFKVYDDERTIRQLRLGGYNVAYWSFNKKLKQLEIGTASSDKPGIYSIKTDKGSRKVLLGTDVIDRESKIRLYRLHDILYPFNL